MIGERCSGAGSSSMVVPGNSKSTGGMGRLANEGGAAATMMVRSNGDGDSDGDNRTETGQVFHAVPQRGTEKDADYCATTYLKLCRFVRDVWNQ